MDRWIAIGTMVLDHMGIGKGSWADICGNMAMPIYTYRQARASKTTSAELLELALISEIPYWVLFGRPGNIIWLFWLVRVSKEMGENEVIKNGELDLFWKGFVAWSVGIWLFSLNMSWGIWIPLLVSGKREVWYGINGAMAMLNWEWLVHLVGYEVARGGSRGVACPRWLWVGAYPVHMGILYCVSHY